MSATPSYAIVALDGSEEAAHKYLTVGDDFEEEGIEKFFKRCQALLLSTLVSHTQLVNAAIIYCCASAAEKKTPERVVHGMAIHAFMGDGFDLDALGTWKMARSPHAWNKDSDEPRRCFVFYWNPNWDEVVAHE